MSEAIAEAEQRLALCLEAMRDTLQLTIEDALPQSTYLGTTDDHQGSDSPGLTEEDGEHMPDTLRQSLEWERGEEVRRVGDRARELQRRMEQLRRAIVALGGGNPTEPIPSGAPVVDIPVEVLDREILALSTESARLGNAMVERYDEAKALASRLEAEMANVKVPSL